MKILILATTYPRGKKELDGNKVHGKFIHSLAKEWVKKGAEVHVLTPHSFQTSSYEELDTVKVHRFHYFFHTKLETLTFGKGIPENIKSFKNKLLVPFLVGGFLLNAYKIIRKNNINILNAHWVVPNGYTALLLKKVFNIKIVVTAYGAELFPIIEGKMKLIKPFIRTTIKKADVVAGISKATVEAVRDIGGRSDIHTIPDGIDISYYKPGIRNEQLLNKYNIKPKEKYIFFTGRMVERKGHIYLLKAFKKLLDNEYDINLILGGKGPMLKKITKFIKENDLTNKVILPGFISEEHIVPLLQSAELFVLPSCVDSNGDTEGSATAALEAMACGTPALISKVGGNIGAINEGEGAFYFQEKNPTDLADKIMLLINNKYSNEYLNSKARNFIEKNYNWDKIIELYKNAINKVT